ncbi:hypothetical protein BD779DRAFT_1458932 [Infundibulicybe gibba]|nr:hypothetical protein BD779DRAFT_1458932 [Infundibulicybe gibba]
MDNTVSSKYNPQRAKYSLSKLPIRTQGGYWDIIRKLDSKSSQNSKAQITKATGVVRLPLCAASHAFIHPVFFPLDPFHLFYENCMAYMWDLWTVFSPENDDVHLDYTQAKLLGEYVVKGMESLPPAFCGPVRDLFLKCQSQYKIYEWMALLHWYIVPIGIELEFNPNVLQNFALFVNAIEFAMTIKPRSTDDLKQLSETIIDFLEKYEKVYIGKNPENISRACLCIFQLIHVPHHIQWIGSVRNGSQATAERSIGEESDKIKSKKAPFANLANNIFQCELAKILCLYYPILDCFKQYAPPLSKTSSIKPMQEWKVQKRKRTIHFPEAQELEAVCSWLNRGKLEDIVYKRWGKIKLKNGYVLQSRLSVSKGQSTRFQKWFEVSNHLIFGEALAFYQVSEQLLVVYYPLEDVKNVLGYPRGKWAQQVAVLSVDKITSIVGIWTSPKSPGNVYILRKHPGLVFLQADEAGKDINENAEYEDLDD